MGLACVIPTLCVTSVLWIEWSSDAVLILGAYIFVVEITAYIIAGNLNLLNQPP